MTQADQVQVRIGMLRSRVAKVGRQFLHARGTNIFPARIGQQHATAQLLQRLAQSPCRWVGADDQKTAGGRFGNLQQARQGPCRGTLQDDRADDHGKGQWHQQ
ncbi:hypothetical protein D9M73_289120 [compost metagenome]